MHMILFVYMVTGPADCKIIYVSFSFQPCRYYVAVISGILTYFDQRIENAVASNGLVM